MMWHSYAAHRKHEEALSLIFQVIFAFFFMNWNNIAFFQASGKSQLLNMTQKFF